jgi:hypothetical protein
MTSKNAAHLQGQKTSFESLLSQASLQLGKQEEAITAMVGCWGRNR